MENEKLKEVNDDVAAVRKILGLLMLLPKDRRANIMECVAKLLR